MNFPKKHVWYQPNDLVPFAVEQDHGLMTIFCKSKIDVSTFGKKQVIKKHLVDLGVSSRISSAARELHLLVNKVHINDYVILPLDEKCLTFIVAEVISEYKYEPESNHVHSRSIKIITSEIKKEILPIGLYKELNMCLSGTFLQRVNFSHIQLSAILNPYS